MILEVENLIAGYDGLRVLNGVTLSVDRGEIVALIGRNGSGKSTLFKAVCGLLRPVSGSIRFHGRRIDALNAERILSEGIGYVPQRDRVFRSLTLDENLDIGGYLLRSRRALAERKRAVYARLPGLRAKARDVAGGLSGGQQQVLGVARALMLAPRLILLDEPSLGVDHKTLEILFDIIRQLRDEGVALFIIERDPRLLCGVADRVLELEDGRTVNITDNARNDGKAKWLKES